MEPKETEKCGHASDLAMIRARLDTLAARLGAPGARGLDAIEDEQRTITGMIRLAIQTDDRPMIRIAAEAETGYAGLTKFVKGEKDLTGATLDRLAKVLGLELTERRIETGRGRKR